MMEWVVTLLCDEVRRGEIVWTGHWGRRTLERQQPDPAQVRYVLCDDAPEAIEHNEPRWDDGWPRRSCLIWGVVQSGRVVHVDCVYPPRGKIVTAYWPDTEPDEWTDDYKWRVPRA